MGRGLTRKREIHAAQIARWGLIAFFVVCLFFGYELDEHTRVSVSHIAMVLLFPFAIFVAWTRGPFERRRFWGTSRDRLIFKILAGYLALRVALSHGNEYFWGQSAKVVLILAGLLCLKILDPRGLHIRYWAWFLPTLLAVLIAIGLVQSSITNEIGVERFHVGPYEYEYISEFSCLMYPLLLFSLNEARRQSSRLRLLAVGLVILIGLVLTAARGALIGTLIALVTYAYFARLRLRTSLLLALCLTVLLVVLVPVANRSADTPQVSRLSLSDDLSLSGRLIQWKFVLDEVFDSRKSILFGAGFGGIVQWVDEDGGFDRPSVTDGPLAAWACLGVVGLCGYLYLFRYLWRRVSLVSYVPYRAMGLSLLLAYIFTDLFETHWEGTRMLWYVSFVFYLVTLPRPPLPLPEKGALRGKSRRYAGPSAGIALPQHP